MRDGTSSGESAPDPALGYRDRRTVLPFRRRRLTSRTSFGLEVCVSNFQSEERRGSPIPLQPLPPTPVRIGIFGAGKLAGAIADEAARSGGAFEISWMLHRGETPPAPVDAAIDASAATAVASHLAWAARTGTPLAVGTTGWNEPEPLERAARSCAVLVAPNFSPGIAVLKKLVADLARFSGAHPESSLAIFEHHHEAKRDSPSGTALALAEAAASASPSEMKAKAQPPIVSMRAGHEIGYHEIVFDAPFEQITISHRARDRRLFASGALAAAKWLIGRRGVFGMDDVAGFTEGR